MLEALLEVFPPTVVSGFRGPTTCHQFVLHPDRSYFLVNPTPERVSQFEAIMAQFPA